MIEKNYLISFFLEENETILDILEFVWEITGTERESDFWKFFFMRFEGFWIIEEDRIRDEGTFYPDRFKYVLTFYVTNARKNMFSCKKRCYLHRIFTLDMDTERPINDEFTKQFREPNADFPLEEE